MTYEIIKTINNQTKIASAENNIYILKEIALSDTEMYKKLINLNCENVIKFFETITIDGKFYVVEEFVNGITLKNDIDNVGCLNDERTTQIILQVCEGLKAIHKLGIVHRDINPNNIMITSDGTVKIIDFGISRTVKANKNYDTEILGTHGFTAPEQFGFHQTTEKSDIYSVGVLINYMMTKQLPSYKLTSGWLSEIVLKCTQIDEVNRYETIDELISAIIKKNKFKMFIKATPGFRKGVWWHYVISIIYYIALLFLYFCAFVGGVGIKGVLFTFGCFFFTFAVPVPILMNYNNWTNRFSFIKSKSKPRKIVIQIALSVVSVIIGLACIIADTNS